jgi:hypothetical protein
LQEFRVPFSEIRAESERGEGDFSCHPPPLPRGLGGMHRTQSEKNTNGKRKIAAGFSISFVGRDVGTDTQKPEIF